MSESMFRRVSHENTQIQKHTNTQIHKYTNTVWTESEDRHDMCYIFEKLMLRGCQNQCLEGSHMKIHKYKNTQIHKYTNTQIQFGRKVKIDTFAENGRVLKWFI